MSLLQSLGHLLGNVNQAGHQSLVDVPVAIAQGLNRSTPWGQAHQQAFNNAPQNQPQAIRSAFTPAVPMQHQASPSLRQVVHPQLQAHQAYNGGQMQTGVNKPMVGGMPTLGVSFHNVQGGIQNPGFIPMQNSGFGPGGNPQIRAFNQPMQPQFNPQDQQDGYDY